MLTKFIYILVCLFALTACTTQNVKPDAADTNCVTEKTETRAIAAVRCQDLFKPKVQVRVIENTEPTTEKNGVKEITFELMNEVMPKSTDETFWKVVEQMSRNEDTKIKLESNKIVLTKKIDDNLKIHSTYVYDPASDNFVLKRIDYTEKNRSTKELSSEPLYKDSNNLKPDLSIKISELATDKKDRTVGVPGYISHAVYSKIEGELKNLNLFTTHELLKLSQLPHKTRVAKYQFLLNSRKVKNFMVNDFMEELIKRPVKMVVISVLSVVVLSHTDFLKNIVSVKNETPEWVAPSVVKMAGRYPESTQVEIVRLMKEINNNNKESIKILEKDIKAEKQLVNIDDVDRFTIQADKKNDKTYFVMSHENQNGTMDMYSFEIDPAKYPELAKRAETAPARDQAD